jgi:GNAT superfamily N-acetyltransferase
MAPGGLSVRRARLSDIPAVLDMIAQLAAHHGDRASVDADTLERDVFGDRPWSELLVAELDQELVGYGILCPLYRAQYGQRGMDLHHLFVLPAQRGKGIGRRLIEAAMDRARALGCRYFSIGTMPDNVAAQRFYLGLGFEQAPPPGPRFRRTL